MKQTLFLDLDEILEIHRDQIERYGGSPRIRDVGLLESALAMPQAGSGCQYFHPSLFDMAAAYLFHIVKNHPFVDGCKRVGAASALVFLKLNGIEVRRTNAEPADTVSAVAKGELAKSGAAEFIRRHARA